MREKLSLLTRPCAMARRWLTSIFRSPTSAISRRCSTVSGSITSRAVILRQSARHGIFRAKAQAASARLSAFGMTKRAGRSAANDPGIAGLLAAQADVITFVARPGIIMSMSRSAAHSRKISKYNQSIEAARAPGREVIFDCEHSSTASRPTKTTRCKSPRPPCGGRPMGRALRYQWRNAPA